MYALRILGLFAIAVAAAVIAVGGAPEERDIDVPALVGQALEDEDLNAVLADSAPQQQVVNGWVARDLLSTIALADDARSERDNRPIGLLLLVVIAICWHPLTLPVVQRGRSVTPPEVDLREESTPAASQVQG